MFDKLNESWALFQASIAVLRSDKHLIVFPLVSGIASLLITVTFLLPAGWYAWSHQWFNMSAHSAQSGTAIDAQLHSPIGYLLMFLFYLTQYVVVFFMNTALIGAAIIRLRGGKPTLQDGFSMATRHFGSIFGYALMASTVGMVIRAVSERAGIFGKLGMGLFGLAWNVATYLVVPVLIMENVGPVAAVKRSTALLKQTWGEQIIGNVGLSYVTSLIMLVVAACFVPFLVMGISMESLPLIVTASVLFVLALTGVALLQSALSGIYTAAIYLYASEGYTGGPFRPDMIQSSFRRK